MSTRFRCDRFVVLIVLALVMTGVFQTGALAQDAPSQIGPIVPPASACTVEPRTIDELQALFAGVTPGDSMPVGTTATLTLGKPADAHSSQQVTAVIHQAIACLNAGDFGRFLALLTDHGIVTIFPWVAEMLVTEESAAEVMVLDPPADEYRQTILGIGSISRLPDGSYSAVLVEIDPNAAQQPTALYLTLAETDGVWRIDGAVEFNESE